VKLAPDSSDAHWLLGHFLGQLSSLVFAGGMRHGAESTGELDRAIEPNPKNADAYVSRAHACYFAPGMFGGSKSKAKEFLDKAITIALSRTWRRQPASRRRSVTSPKTAETKREKRLPQLWDSLPTASSRTEWSTEFRENHWTIDMSVVSVSEDGAAKSVITAPQAER
jgi:hypothetical protein